MTSEKRKEFAREVQIGLRSDPKSLPSKYFYDERGDELFVQIMNSEEYYLTDAESEIFQNQTTELAQPIIENQPTEIIELGAGDGSKTKYLLGYLVNKNIDFTYKPIDISSNALEVLRGNLQDSVPGIDIELHEGEYFEVLDDFSENKKHKVVLFLGSTLGNMPDEESVIFLSHLSSRLNKGDHLIIGADLIKSADIVLPAYDDKKGLTAEFNFNLLKRINRELGADFDLSKFLHTPEYDEEFGAAYSYLTARERHSVFIKRLEEVFTFKEGEKIFMEISRKFDDDVFKTLIDGLPFVIKKKLTDSRNYFADYILAKK